MLVKDIHFPFFLFALYLNAKKGMKKKFLLFNIDTMNFYHISDLTTSKKMHTCVHIKIFPFA
jgi:hypothetical protein